MEFIVPLYERTIKECNLECNEERLVRCKDCKKCIEMKVHKTHWCNGPKNGPTKPDGFCDEGELAVT